MASALRQLAPVLAQETKQEVNQATRHVDQPVQFGPERVVLPQELGFSQQVLLDRLANALVEELRLPRGIEESVKVGRVVPHADIALLGRFPVHGWQHPLRVVFQRRPVGADPLQNRRRNRKDQPLRTKAASSQDMVDQVAVQPTVAVFEGMHVDEAEGKDRSRDNRIELRLRLLIEGDQALDEIGQVFGASADMGRDRHACLPVVLANETALDPQAEPHEPGVPDNDALETQQLVGIDRLQTGLADGSAPSLDARLRPAFSFDGKAGLGVLEQQERGCPGDQVPGRGSDGLQRSRRQVHRRQTLQLLGPKHQRTELGRTGQIVLHAVAA